MKTKNHAIRSLSSIDGVPKRTWLDPEKVRHCCWHKQTTCLDLEVNLIQKSVQSSTRFQIGKFIMERLVRNVVISYQLKWRASAKRRQPHTFYGSTVYFGAWHSLYFHPAAPAEFPFNLFWVNLRRMVKNKDKHGMSVKRHRSVSTWLTFQSNILSLFCFCVCLYHHHHHKVCFFEGTWYICGLM